MIDYSEDYLLGRKVRIFQPKDGYRASSDAVLLASAVTDVKRHDSFLDAGSGTGAVSLCLAARLCEHDIRLTGIEIQPDLVELSSLSARANGFGSMKFIDTDLKNALFIMLSAIRLMRKKIRLPLRKENRPRIIFLAYQI